VVLGEAERVEAVARDRAAGRTIAFANGCFDLLHVGHVRYLQGAAAEADRLIVAVNDDRSVAALKGAGRPILAAAERAELVCALRGVDYVVLFGDLTVERLLRLLEPDVHCKGTDYTVDTVPERAAVLTRRADREAAGDRDPVHLARQVGVVVDRVVLGGAVVPHSDVARCPGPADRVLQAGHVRLEKVEQVPGIARGHPEDAADEVAEQQRPLPRLRMDPDERVLGLVDRRLEDLVVVLAILRGLLRNAAIGGVGGFAVLLRIAGLGAALSPVGLAIVAIAAVFPKTPVLLVAKKESGITKLEDFPGKKVSMWYTGTQYIVRAMLRNKGIDPAKIIEVPQPVTMAPFLRNEVSVACVTVFNELQSLIADGVTDLVLFDPADYGIIIPRDTIVTTEKMIKERPEVVQRFLRASLRGWKYAIENQPEAVDITLKQSPNLKKDHQTIMLREVAKLMTWGPSKEKGLGYLDPKATEFTMSFLLENKQLSKAVPIGEAVNTRFWTEVPTSLKVVR